VLVRVLVNRAGAPNEKARQSGTSRRKKGAAHDSVGAIVCVVGAS
jgi:hypothetical protein